MARSIKIKVCGLIPGRQDGALLDMGVDYLGFICYPLSPRYIGLHSFSVGGTEQNNKVGVFVNAAYDEIMTYRKKVTFHTCQLHGNETLSLCQQLKQSGLRVIKTFSILSELPISLMTSYDGVVDYFLLDTHTSSYGGSGRKFNWEILREYDLSTPLFLSGGIGPEDIDDILKVKDKIYGVDVNSRFELRPGDKNLELLSSFLEQLKQTI